MQIALREEYSKKGGRFYTSVQYNVSTHYRGSFQFSFNTLTGMSFPYFTFDTVLQIRPKNIAGFVCISYNDKGK